jgi:hypothetical protein
MSTRKALAVRDGERFRCRASVTRFGSKRAYGGGTEATILLSDIRDVVTGRVLSDHLWFTSGKWCSGLQIDAVIEFDARVSDYEKGYKGRREDVFVPIKRDWKLQRPTKVQIIPKVREGTLG